MNNVYYNPYLRPSHQNSHIFSEIRAEEHDGDVKFLPEVESR